jgi:hypothetical protein
MHPPLIIDILKYFTMNIRGGDAQKHQKSNQHYDDGGYIACGGGYFFHLPSLIAHFFSTLGLSRLKNARRFSRRLGSHVELPVFRFFAKP